MNQNSIFPYIIDFRCRSQQITNFLVGKNLQVLFDDNYKFGTITLDRSRSIDFETYFQLINNKILFFAFEDLRKIIILMFEFVKRLLQNNLNLNGNYDWKQMVIQLDQDGQFEGVILLNLQEEVSQNIIIFATIVFQLGDKINLSYEDLDILRTLVDELTRNNFTNNAQMQVENNSNKTKSQKQNDKNKIINREKLQKQINKAITFNNNKPQNIQDTPLDIRCKLQINNAQFMKILLAPQANVKYKQNGNTNYLIKEEQSPLFDSLLYELVDRLKQRYYAIDRRLVHNLKDKGEIQQYEFILQYLQMIGLFNYTNFEIEIEVIVIQFQIHIQQYLQTYYLSKEQLPTLDGYLEKVVILECIESSCILTECIFGIFNQSFEHLECFHTSMINEKYKIEIKKQPMKYIKKMGRKQHIILFEYYDRKLKAYENDIRIIYFNSIEFEFDQPQLQDQFNNYCFQEFNKIINDTQPLNLETLNLNVKDALYYATNQYQLLRLKIDDQQKNDVTSINFGQIEKMFYERFYKGWKEGMGCRQMNELLNLQVFEQQIHSEIKFNRIVNAFIEFSSQEGHYYLFDEEYQQIHQNQKIQEILNQNLLPFKLSSEQYQEILNQLKFDQVIELVKKLVTDQIKIPKEFSKNHYFNGKAFQFLFNHVRNSVQKDKGNCSFYELLSLSLSSENLIKMLFEQFPQDPNVIAAIRKEYDSSLTLTRQKIKHHIPSEEEYLKVIDKSDPLFLEIVRSSDNFDQAQIAYFQQLLIQRWKTCKQETQKHQEINEEVWERIFQTLQKKIEQSIGNKLNQLEVGKPLVDTFRKQWINIWDPKIIVAFLDVSEK